MEPEIATRKQINTVEPKIHVAFELSLRNWKLCLVSGDNLSYKDVPALDLEAVFNAIGAFRRRHGLYDAPVHSCYEAGREGFSLHRCLAQIGVQNLVVDSASIEVNRRAKRSKTDRLDSHALVRMLLRYLGGETEVCSVVRVPSPEAEDQRQLHRNLESLKAEKLAMGNQVESLLLAQGVSLRPRPKLMHQWPALLASIRTLDGRPLGQGLVDRLLEVGNRFNQVQALIVHAEKQMKNSLKAEPSRPANRLTEVRGVGVLGAWILEKEFFWRNFENAKQVGSAAGLAPTPYSSGNSKREQGISKAGNRRIRALMIQLAWSWIRLQPDCELTLWFHRRFSGSMRMRRIGVVALARKLLVALWRYSQGKPLPQGARVKYTVKTQKLEKLKTALESEKLKAA